MGVPNWNHQLKLFGYMKRLPPPPSQIAIQRIYEAIKASKKPVFIFI